MKHRSVFWPSFVQLSAVGMVFVSGCAVDQGDTSEHLDRSSSAVSATQPMPVISRNAPAYASSGTASQGNDASYDTIWRSSENTSSSSPSWIAYDLSGVPAASRGQVDVVWYNANNVYADYDLAAQAGTAYNEPRDYTIDVNTAPGGALPTSGWQTLVTVTGNTRISREHVINLRPSASTTYNWVRLHVTAINGAEYNTNTAVNLDIHNAAQGAQDSWLFLGDSITAFFARNDGAGIGAPSFAERVNAAKPGFFPAAEGAGEGGWNSGTALGEASPDGNGTLFDYWLRTFPGKFVCLGYGTNDGTDGSGNASGTYDNFATMVTKVIAAGKVPAIPHVPWAEDAAHQKNAQLVNAQIDALYAKYPQVVKGPDLYGILQGHTEWYQDNLHPNPQGQAQYRQAWANAMLSSVYAAGATSTPTTSPTTSATTPPPSPAPAGGSDTAEYSFESGLQGWSASGPNATITTSTAMAYRGKASLAATLDNTSASAQTYSLAVDPGSSITGAATITMHFWYPANAGIAFVGGFAQEQASPWTMVPPQNQATTAGAWNTWTFSVPATDTPLQVIALQFKVNAGSDPTVYVDSVSW